MVRPLAATMRMAVAVPAESMRPAAEAAIGHAAIFPGPPVRPARQLGNASGTAVASPHESHRYRANVRGTHHGQDDAARAFHVAAPRLFLNGQQSPSPGGSEASESRSFHGIVLRQ